MPDDAKLLSVFKYIASKISDQDIKEPRTFERYSYDNLLNAWANDTLNINVHKSNRELTNKLVDMSSAGELAQYANILYRLDDRSRYIAFKMMLRNIRPSGVFSAYSEADKTALQMTEIVASSQYSTLDDKITAIDSGLSDDYFAESAIAMLREQLKPVLEQPFVDMKKLNKIENDAEKLADACADSEALNKYTKEIETEFNHDALMSKHPLIYRQSLPEEMIQMTIPGTKHSYNVPKPQEINEETKPEPEQATLLELELQQQVSELQQQTKELEEQRDSDSKHYTETIDNLNKKIEDQKNQIKRMQFYKSAAETASKTMAMLQTELDTFLNLEPGIFKQNELRDAQKKANAKQLEIKKMVQAVNDAFNNAK